MLMNAAVINFNRRFPSEGMKSVKLESCFNDFLAKKTDSHLDSVWILENLIVHHQLCFLLH